MTRYGAPHVEGVQAGVEAKRSKSKCNRTSESFIMLSVTPETQPTADQRPKTCIPCPAKPQPRRAGDTTLLVCVAYASAATAKATAAASAKCGRVSAAAEVPSPAGVCADESLLSVLLGGALDGELGAGTGEPAPPAPPGACVFAGGSGALLELDGAAVVDTVVTHGGSVEVLATVTDCGADAMSCLVGTSLLLAALAYAEARSPQIWATESGVHLFVWRMGQVVLMKTEAVSMLSSCSRNILPLGALTASPPSHSVTLARILAGVWPSGMAQSFVLQHV